MTTRPPADDVPARRIDSLLAFAALGLLVLSIISFFSIMIATATGLEQADFASGIWPLVTVVVWVGPILAFAMILFILISSFVRRARANRGA